MYGVEHRLTTAYHPRANGLVERQNKEVSRALKKYMVGATGEWENWLPLIQLSLNTHTNQRTASKPFELMFGRAFNNFENFQLNENEEIDSKVQTLENWTRKQRELSEVILPGVGDRISKRKSKMQENFDRTHKLKEPLPVGTRVMALDRNRNSKWDPVYDGPYTIVRQHRGGTYELRDVTGAIVPGRRTIEMLKELDDISDVPRNAPEDETMGTEEESDEEELERNHSQKEEQVTNDAIETTTVTTMDETIFKHEEEENEHYEVEKILNHKKKRGQWTYLVKWKNWDDEYNSWVDANDFDELGIIRQYWSEHAKITKEEMKRRETKKRQNLEEVID